MNRIRSDRKKYSKNKVCRWALMLLLTAAMCFAFAACGDSGNDGGDDQAATETMLQGATLVGQFDESSMVGIDIGPDVTVEVYNAESGEYEEGAFDEETILGNYVRFLDNDADEKADQLQVVQYGDSEKVWDADMQWLDGAGEDNEPALPDAKAKQAFTGDAAAQRIPFGERLMSELGFSDYSGVNDYNNVDSDEYWNHNDWYTQKSGGSLILLEGFKTQMQSTFWACTMTTAEMVLEWYGQRGDLNDRDLAAMIPDKEDYEDGAIQAEQEQIFKRLAEQGKTCEWTIESCLDEQYAESLQDPEYIKEHLKAGHPIILNWNSWGSHATVCIGYDDMGTDTIEDDVLILADPFDTTDQLNDGYNIEPYARVAKGLSEDDEDDFQAVRFLVPYPANDGDWEGYTPSTDGTVPESYTDSPYYPVYSYFDGEGPTDSLMMIKNYKTVQQDGEWDSGSAAVSMLREHFGQDGATPDVSRDRPAFVSEMVEALDGWTMFTNYDTEYDEDDEVHYLNDDYGMEDNLVPYLIEHDIPILVGWDEWGGHWQTIIGYDDMGTEETEDDVIIMADSRDTTDHHADGYVIESFERLMFGFNAQFEENDSAYEDATSYGVFIVAFPDDAPGADEVKAELGL